MQLEACKVLRGLWLTSMGLGKTRTGNVRYMKQLSSLIRKKCLLDLAYYTSHANHKLHLKDLNQRFNKVHLIESPSGYNARPRGGEDSLNSINDWISRDLINWCEANVTSKEYNFIICDYIYMSPVFDNIDDRVVKIINTHDRIGNRHIDLGWDEQEVQKHFSVSNTEEVRALNKADILLAITENEFNYFRTCQRNARATSQLVQYIPDNPRFNKREELVQPPKLTLGFMGSSNPVNANGINEFINQCQRLGINQLSLVLAGKICGAVNTDNKWIRKIGEIDNEGEFYGKIDCLINPMPKGSSGLKIKTIDSLANSVPVIGTKDAFWGLNTNSVYHNFESIEELANFVCSITLSKQFIRKLSDDSEECLKNYTAKTGDQIKNLMQAIEKLWYEKEKQEPERLGRKEESATYNKIIANIHDNYQQELLFYRNQSKINYDKFKGAENKNSKLQEELELYIKKHKSISKQTGRAENSETGSKVQSSTIKTTKDSEGWKKNKGYDVLNDMLASRKRRDRDRQGEICIEHGLGIGDGLMFSSIIKTKYCLNYSHVYLKTAKLKALANILFAGCKNLTVVEQAPKGVPTHVINFAEAVYHFSWRYPVFRRDAGAENSAHRRFVKKYGQDYILIHERLADNMNREMKPINKLLISNPNNLPVINLDYANMKMNGLEDIDYLHFGKIIESAYSIHFYEGSFSHLADICDLSMQQEQPSMHLYCKPHLWDKNLPHNKILFFLEMNNWFRYNWRVYAKEDGELIKKKCKMLK